MTEIVGASFTGFTVSRKLVLVGIAPSVTVTVIRLVPDKFATGVIVSMRFTPLPVKTRFAFGTRVKLVEVPEIPRLTAAVSKSPMVNGIDATVSSLIVWLPMAEMVGASFTALTVSVKLVVAAKPSGSRTVTEIIVKPDWFAEGVSVTVRLEALPPKTMFEFATRPGFDELPETVRLVAGDSRSPTVKAIAGLAVSSLVD